MSAVTELSIPPLMATSTFPFLLTSLSSAGNSPIRIGGLFLFYLFLKIFFLDYFSSARHFSELVNFFSFHFVGHVFIRVEPVINPCSVFQSIYIITDDIYFSILEIPNGAPVIISVFISAFSFFLSVFIILHPYAVFQSVFEISNFCRLLCSGIIGNRFSFLLSVLVYFL